MLVIDKVPPADLSLDAVIERLPRMVIAGLRTRANQPRVGRAWRASQQLL
jgi:hypothetical protein